MARQSQVIIRPEHNDLLAVDRDDWVLGRADLAEHLIHAGVPHFLRAREFSALLENVHNLSSRKGRRG